MTKTPLFAAALALAGVLCAQNQPPAPPADQKPAKAAFVPKAEIYPLDTCVVSGEKLDADAVTFVVEGRTFKTCCPKCKPKVEKDPATFAKKIDEALVKTQAGHYPLDTCPISGKKLGSMGDPVQLVLDGTLVQLCCSNCTKKATAGGPAMALKVREAAYTAQLKTYPLTTCVVSGEKLDDDAVSVMFGTTLVRFCCEKCIAKLEQDPAKFVAKLHPAGGDKTGPAKKDGGKTDPKGGKDGEDCCAGGCCCNADPSKPAPVKPGDKNEKK